VRDWAVLLIGCVSFGGAIVAALVLPRHASLIAALAAVACLLASATSFGSIVARYATPEAIAGSMAVFISGITAGYAVVSTLIPYFDRPGREPILNPGQGDIDGVVLVGCCDPERYDLRAVARRQNLLEHDAGIVVPVTALPFVFFAERARYRTIGGRSPGHAAARRVADRLLDGPGAAPWRVALAWCHTPATPASAVASLAREGVRRIALVPLGLPESGPLDEARKPLDDLLRVAGAPAVGTATSIWQDRLLPGRLAERIIAATAHAAPSEVGVVLVSEGAPPVWEKRYASAAETETYFDQRVRALLGDAGIPERQIRMCWLEWQTPDVTEAVRHVAALGCTRIVVAPATIALPTLQTSLDLSHAVALARVPEEVLVVTLQPWGDDGGFVDAVRRSAAEALGALRERELDS